MSNPASPRSTADGLEVVKWYTRARRFPQLIGKTPDGATIWGGPYTYTQVIAGAVMVVIGSKTMWLWGHFGLVGNAIILLVVTYGIVVLLGRLPIGSRNPISVAAGAIRAVGAPTRGRVQGSPVRFRRPASTRWARVVIDNAASPGVAHPSPPDRAVEPTPNRLVSQQPALTAVQRLLAHTPAPREDNL